MGTKHTPGPWAIRRGHSVVEIRTTAGLEIAATTGGPYWENFTDEALANARLIAAAPELLEAGTEALDTIEKLIADLREAGADEHAQRIAVLEIDRDNLRAAIAKATGND